MKIKVLLATLAIALGVVLPVVADAAHGPARVVSASTSLNDDRVGG